MEKRNLILETGLSGKKAGTSNKRPIFGFTLVELIVVITILAILGTIAIMAFSGYSKNARNSARIADITNMKKSLELWILQSGTYPEPTSGTNVTYSGATVWTQGTFGDSVHQTVGKLEKKPLDPIYDIEYTYSVTQSKKEYQLGAVLEKDMAFIDSKTGLTQKFGRPVLSSIIPQTYAAETSGEAYVTGNYNGVVTSTQTGGLYYILAVPSIILSDVNDSNLLGTKQFVLNKKHNIPHSYANTSLTMTGTEVDYNPIVVWSGTGYTNLNDQTTFESLVINLQTAYSDPLFETLPEYTSIAATSNLAPEAISAVKSIIEISTNQELTNVSITQTLTPLLGWRVQDPNCDINDIEILDGSGVLVQTWAGCNSTLGTGFDWGQTDTDIGTSNYNGTEGSCYDYSGNNTGVCTKGNPSMASTTKANTWFTGTNVNLDSEFAAIWGKLYTWDSMDTDSNNIINASDTNKICGIGYHLPSDAEWETLETTLNGGINCRNATDGWLCDGLGWSGTGVSTRKMADTLKIPLAGSRNTDSATFNNRGNDTLLWSSTPLTTNAYYRHLNWLNPTVLRLNHSQTYGFSVRCLKD